MFAMQNITRSTTRIAPAIRRVGLAQTLPSLSRASLRSFWDQKQPEHPKNTNTAPKNNANQQQKSNGGRQETNGKQEKADKGNVEPDFVAPGPPFPGFSPYFFGLLAVGLGLVSYGLYGLYAMTTLWPPEVRHDLRKGLRAKRKGEWDTAIQYISRAWDTARTVPRETFGPQALLKITGIGIALAGALEEHGKPAEAYRVYQDVLWLLRTAYVGPDIAQKMKDADPGIETIQVLTPAEKVRAIALAYKLGELAQRLGRPAEEEERWLVWSVEALLRTVLHAAPVGKVEAVGAADPQGSPDSQSVKVIVEVLGLPVWAAGHNIAAPFEALASFYARQGNAEYALPLYLQAISILLPAAPAVSTVEDRCRGAQLMGNIADLILRARGKDEQPEALFQAESWAKKGLEIVDATRKATSQKCPVCEEAYAVLLYNMGVIRELAGDENRARELLTQSLQQSTKIGMEEAVKHANGALHHLNGNGDGVKPDDSEIALAAGLE